MAPHSLRELKKDRTRRLIAQTAARLFAERGYEHVAVRDVAAEAEVAEQTVYNYFPTKDRLVTDREQDVSDRLCELIRARPNGTTPAAAVRGFLLDSVAGIGRIPSDEWRGELGYLASISPTVHRLVLELIDRQAGALAVAISETSTIPPEVSQLEGIALAGVFRILINEAGRRTVDGQSQATIAERLEVEIATVIDELDVWFAASAAREGRAVTREIEHS